MTTGLYAPMPRSPITSLAEGIDASQTTIPLVNAGLVPDAPNIATIGAGPDSETVRFTGKSGNTLTGATRGFDPAGSAKAWDSGTPVARVLTAQDLAAVQAILAAIESVDGLATEDDLHSLHTRFIMDY